MQNQFLQAIIMAVDVFVHTLVSSAIAIAKPLFDKMPYHTFILIGEG
jgi:hypothetical protein